MYSTKIARAERVRILRHHLGSVCSDRFPCTLFEGHQSGGLSCAVIASTTSEITCVTPKPPQDPGDYLLSDITVVIDWNAGPYTARCDLTNGAPCQFAYDIEQTPMLREVKADFPLNATAVGDLVTDREKKC